jgi:RNA polymerase sigma-70 factor (ECF subfamily)
MSADADFDALFRAHVGAIHAYALRRSDPATADEVVADTFLVCWRRLDRVPGEPLPWLYGVARRCLANRIRAERREQARRRSVAGWLPLDPPPGTSELYEQRARSREVLVALSQLPPREREALQLCAWEGLGPSEAARAAGCTGATFRVRLHRARRRLAALLDAPPEPTTGLQPGEDAL